MASWGWFGVWLAVTAAVWFLEVQERTLPISLTLVEWETSLGFPVYVLPAALAAWSLVGSLLKLGRGGAAPAPARDLRQAPTRSLSRPAAPAAPGSGADWYDEALRRAKALSLEPQGHLRLDEAMGLPFTLTLRNATVEQARRRLDAFAGFLAGIPTPPKARVYVESCPDIQIAPQHLVGAALKKHFAEDRFYLMVQGGGVDVVFSDPDPRWAGR